MNDDPRSAALVDAHVHVYGCFAVPDFLYAAHTNLATQAERMALSSWDGILLLAETSSDHWFERLAAGRAGDELGGWSVSRAPEAETLALAGPDAKELLVVAGHQIVTRESLEVLALGTRSRIADGMSLSDTVEAVAKLEAICVLPWGNGKWLGERGRLVRDLIESVEPGAFHLGDNSGRLRWLREPSEFGLARDRNLTVLPGSDCLPFRSEMKRAGSFGFAVYGNVDTLRPLTWLRRRLTDKATAIEPFGSCETLSRFLRNQIGMQLRKWTQAR